MSEELLSKSVGSLLGTAVIAVVSYVLGHVSAGKSRSSLTDKWVMVWLWWDLLIHILLEAPFVVISLFGSIKESDSFLADTWKEYSKADKRWGDGISDPNIVSLEILTVFLCGPLCLGLIYAICKGKFYRHYLQITLCVCELYGGWMTFGPEWLTGSPNLVTDNWLYMWVYLVFFNGVWVVVPLALMWQSFQAMKRAFPERGNKKQQQQSNNRPNTRSKKNK